MQTTDRIAKTLSLGAVVEMICRQESAVAIDQNAVADLAARRLERVLVRGGNARLAAALATLAQELAPTSSRATTRSRRGNFRLARAA
jgi:hypothetical protein